MSPRGRKDLVILEGQKASTALHRIDRKGSSRVSLAHSQRQLSRVIGRCTATPICNARTCVLFQRLEMRLPDIRGDVGISRSFSRFDCLSDYWRSRCRLRVEYGVSYAWRCFLYWLYHIVCKNPPSLTIGYLNPFLCAIFQIPKPKAQP